MAEVGGLDPHSPSQQKYQFHFQSQNTPAPGTRAQSNSWRLATRVRPPQPQRLVCFRMGRFVQCRCRVAHNGSGIAQV